MLTIRSLIAFVALSCSQVFAQDVPGIFMIFEQFVISSAAAEKCSQPDEEIRISFQANFQMISLYAAQELEKQFPQRSRSEIAEAMKRMSADLTGKTISIIADKGCDDEGVKQIVERFYVQAKWKL